MSSRSVLLFLCITGFVSAGSSQMCIGILLPYIVATSDWTSQQIAGALLIATIAGALSSLIAGTIVDRGGGRLIMLLGAISFSAGLLLISRAHSLVTFYLGYSLSRGAAQSILGGAAQRAIIVRHFSTNRGRVLGTAAMAIPLGSAALGFISQYAIEAGLSWRQWFAFLAAFSALAFLPTLPIAICRSQNDSAQSRHSAKEESARLSLLKNYDWPFSAIMRHWKFYAIVLATMLSVSANSALVFHHVAYLTTRGVSSSGAAAAVSVLALSGAAASLLWGYLSDKVSERVLATTSQALAAIPIISLVVIDTTTFAITISAIIGLLIRGEGAIAQLLIARYFGVASFGRTVGVMTALQMFALGAGPLLGSVLLDLGGSYRIFYGFLAGVYLAAALIFAGTRPPGRWTGA